MGRGRPRKETQATVLEQLVADGRALNVFRPEFLKCYEITAELIFEFNQRQAEYKNTGYATEVDSDGKIKKAPSVAILETLRKDILAYLNALGLTAAGYRRCQGTEPTEANGKFFSSLASILQKHDEK